MATPSPPESDDSMQNDREARLKKDRLRKTKYRQEKMAEMHELKVTASALTLQLEQLKAQRSQHVRPRLPSLTSLHAPRLRLSWRYIADREKMRLEAAYADQTRLRNDLVTDLHRAFCLLQSQRRAPRKMLMDVRTEPRTAYTLPHHPLRRLETIQRLLQWQADHVTDAFVAHVLPNLDDDDDPAWTMELTPDGASVAYIETRSQGVVYASAGDVGAVLWQLETAQSRHTTVAPLDSDTVVVSSNDDDTTLLKRLVHRTAHGAARVLVVAQSVLADESSSYRIARKSVATWLVVDELPRGASDGPVSVYRSVQQAALEGPLDAYAEHLVATTATAEMRQHALARHFHCL
ncbi:hypothetical protein SPRG_05047 [Saprolegnia parasitica CBS 223.65]|uniref:BZIP domain-containing protein n=1 Tax=Saprolegnia parasitica (strain CBS 223.65) TaxID=695850 RepID=A0A067CUY8_SAPPC|nr:hypothetical protein SPRG_05047 [Saprolegnia parasitica CBS 223.65]KDO30336.1 hypothetical protein SPRG_05047 [Saprolegnia parasitica CBS 223.65]|eukprot:XP_012198946.1 hypothetical protein SPRG_05047 [Saprolegnia parasitica CBS 223.65]